LQPLYELKNVGKTFTLPHNQTINALKDINLAIAPGEIVALIGPSGCGKSTFLRILSGLETPTEGAVFYKGKEKKGILHDCSMVFQSFALYPWLTVKQNISVVLEALFWPEEKIRKEVEKIIDTVGLKGFEESYPKELSGGMKQKVGIARALVRNPSLLLMDEPFSALDAFTAESLRAEVLEIWSKRGSNLSSVLLVSHEIQEVVYMADRIVVLGANPGHIVLNLENKLPRPRDYRANAFLDLVNLIHATYYKTNGNGSKKHLKTGIFPLLPVSHDEILGFLNYLNRKKEPSDLSKIGKESHQHFERVILVGKAAEQLKLVQISEETVLLTEAGRSYLKADDTNKRLIWNERLLAIPLFSTVSDWIKKAPEGLLPKEELLEKLARQLPEEDADLQMKTLLRWSRYGNLFKAHRKTKTISL